MKYSEMEQNPMVFPPSWYGGPPDDPEEEYMNRNEEIVSQLNLEHRDGIAEERLEQERRTFTWDIEGWSSTDQLLLHIAGMGLLRIPMREVIRLANALMSEYEIHEVEDA